MGGGIWVAAGHYCYRDSDKDRPLLAPGDKFCFRLLNDLESTKLFKFCDEYLEGFVLCFLVA